ncbi:type I methionyl aminopeptidase [Paenibacillus hamazuiensis]|uniref:type I methionyl aminopeptidase n=1 Tax=Paenibacillus hamazuiensis TaxID=2936508 RepID=UPI00200E58ED|nr:type I methionyl aminopeptidase [Paenibacillus hamazuiensis]
MVKLKTADDINRIRKTGRIVAECHQELSRRIKPGISTLAIDEFVERYLEERGASQVIKGYKGFPYATCASVNDVVAHGFPSDEPLREGDIVTIDIVAKYDGWMADSAWTYAVGSVSEEAERLIKVTKECLYLGIRHAQAGKRIGDAMHEVQSHAERNGYSVVRDLVGHGIGRSLHEDPKFPHVGKPGRGFTLKEGMVITIEPMINVGSHELFLEMDGWTVRTLDGRLSAQYEHTIAITKEGPVILTEV